MKFSTKKELGGSGEEIASRWLAKKGYRIIERNFSFRGNFRKGEIDIIAEKDKLITFFEVKTSISGGSDFFPEDKIDFRKQKQVLKISQEWLIENNIPFDSSWQIDVITVRINKQTKKALIRHLKNAFGS